ncbi:formin-like protein 18 isoform X1 [Quercus lobata]|uniref:formin-like protein 18 isoform X1 n=1 Tax=Quercus lobata TaxID=97700 RepID=UPI00124718AE|nr:formin-like protein 18 isoform X1 [Quercus lobata]
MALLRKLFFRKPPDGLLEICERVYVFDCCFTTDAWSKDSYKEYIGGIAGQLRDHLPDSQFLVFHFREGHAYSEITDILSEYDMTIMDYPRHFEGCPVLTIEVIHHFLKSSESWLASGNVLLMHCERGGWPVLAFMLAALLIYRKLHSGEQKTLDMVYKQAPRELLQLMSPLNPIPSQLRYLQYVSRRNVAFEWPPLDRALTLDCVMLRLIPNFGGQGGCRPIFRVYGQDPFLVADKTPKALYAPKGSKSVRAYKQAECELVKIDINCHIQGDVVVECVCLNDDMEREEMMFRVTFNTAFIRSNILIVNRDEIDILWNAKDQFPKDFRAEILFSEMDAAASIVLGDVSCFEEEGLPMEAFAKVQEIFNYVDWLDPKADAALNVLQQELSPRKLWQKKKPTVFENRDNSSLSSSLDIQSLKVAEPHDIQIALQLPSQSDIMFQGMPQSSKSTTVSCKSVQGTPVTPTFGIECQLHDCALSEGAKVTQPAPVPPTVPEPPLAVSHAPESVDTKSVSIAPKTSPPAPPPPPLLTDCSTKTLPSPSPPPPLPPHQLSEPTHSSLTNDIYYKDHSSMVSPPVSVRPPPPPPPPPPHTGQTSGPLISNNNPLVNPPLAPIVTSITRPPPTPPPPPPPTPPLKENIAVRAGHPPPPTPPPPPPPTPPLKENIAVRAGHPLPPTPPPPPPPTPHLKENIAVRAGHPPPPPPPPPHSGQAAGPRIPSSVPPPPPAPIYSSKHSDPASVKSSPVPSVPPPPAPSVKGVPGSLSLGSIGNSSPNGGKGRIISRTISSKSNQAKKLRPLHWMKLTRAMSGSLWAEAQKSGDAAKAPEIDMSELENLFSAAVPTSDHGRKSKSGSAGPKSDKVQLIDHRRAYNCEIMLSKVKVPLHDLMSSVLALEDSALDVDQVENLIKFCPTKEEMELLKGYTGEKEKLGKCEQFFLELMQVPRVESKLRVFSFKIQFHSQVSDLRSSLSAVYSAAEEIKGSVKLKRIMQTVLSLGNALNQGTARGSAIGFRLDSLLKLTDTRAQNKKTTLMHYLCKVLADKLPEVLDFSKDLASLEAASKIQMRILAEEMQAISKGLEKVVQELSTSEIDGPVSENFRKILKEFLLSAEAEVRSLASLYSGVGRNVDAMIIYFGEDPSRCPFEQVISTLRNFVRMFNQAHVENCRQLELETKKAAESEKLKMDASHKESKRHLQTPIHTGNVK